MGQQSAESRPPISVIIPVLNGAAHLDRMLTALGTSQGVGWEWIVVDDGSTDASVQVAERHGARVLHTGRAAAGPAFARNAGAQAAHADLLCFLDADVVPTSETLSQFVALFREDPTRAAAFGSYDDRPAEPGFFSRYRNLLHHFVHQHGSPSATTFWSGCGAIRRDVFVEMRGFDAVRYPRPSIEDIELGARLTAAGYPIRLARHIQVKHLKHWGLGSIVRTDVRDRAVPWTQLIVRNRHLPNALNLDWSSRLSAGAVGLTLVLLLLGVLRPRTMSLAPVPAWYVLLANRDLYALFLRRGGLKFAIGGVAMHWLYFLCSSIGLAYGTLTAHRAEASPHGEIDPPGSAVAALTGTRAAGATLRSHQARA